MMPTLGNQTLLDISLPGTHDTMTYDMSTTVSDNANDMSPTVAWLLHEFHDDLGVGSFIRDMVRGFVADRIFRFRASSGGRCALVNTPLVAWMACNETVVLMCVFSGGHTGVEHHVPVEQWHPLHRFPCGVLGWPECVQHVTVQLVLPPHGGEQQPCRHIPEADSAVDG